MHINMLQANADVINRHWVMRRGFTDRAGLDAALADGRLTGHVVDGTQMFNVADLRRVFGDNDQKPSVYGLQWGDPESEEDADLAEVRDAWLKPYLGDDTVVLEIGPGGGRWTRYMTGCRKIIAIDYFEEVLAELKRTGLNGNIAYVKNNGTDFPGVADASVDFVFSFGVLVHIEPEDIRSYLHEIVRVLKPVTGRAVLQFADKSKPLAQENKGFSDMTPDRFRKMIADLPLDLVRADLALLEHSTIVELKPAG